MKHFDYIIAGAGCAGMSLMFSLINSPLKDKKILLVDHSFTAPPAKTWCYWNTVPLEIHPPDKIQSWSKMSLQKNETKLNLDLNGLNYYHINSFDFFEWMNSLISSHPTITKLEGQVDKISETEGEAFITTNDGMKYTADYVFDSRLNSKEDFSPDVLKQVFSGWRIETESPVFDSTSATLMDFSDMKGKGFEFIYILPYSNSSALVEFTTYSKDKIDLSELDQSLQEYLASTFPGIRYEISYREDGIIPMTTKMDNSVNSKKIIPIGTRAGWTKASTGYTFHTIQKHSQKIVSNLINAKHPLRGITKASRFNFYDNILLNIASKWPDKLQSVFYSMFKSIPSKDVIKFLNEETRLVEELLLLSKLDFKIFVQSLLRYERH